jgi:hypothetical protein
VPRGGISSPGESTGADEDVRIAQERGLPVYHRVEDVPGYRAACVPAATSGFRSSA